jgi:membrane associated rhomboid family serine protease
VFPYKDENPTVLTPIVTVAIIAVTTAIWILVQGAGFDPRLTQSVCELGAIPARVFHEPARAVLTPDGPILPCGEMEGGGWYTVLTSVFLHGGWFHLIGNLWFLWVFGNNIEDSMGHVRFVFFYLLCGILAAMAQMIVDTASAIPLVGASGAISGVMGAYLILYPRVRVHTIVFLGFFITRVTLPAYFMLLYWAFIQVVGSLPSIGGGGQGGVAFLAHLGGFLAGAGLIKVFSKPELLAAHARRRPIIVGDIGDRFWR